MQLYTFREFASSNYTPVAYFLLKDKCKESYFTMAKMLKNEVNFNLVPIILDFETGPINALKRVFPSAYFHGCQFHLAQSWYRKIGEWGLITE